MRKTSTLLILALSIPGAAQATSLSESTIDAAIRAGTLPIRRHGNRTMVLTRDLERWLESLPTNRPAPPLQFAGRRTGRPKNVISCASAENTAAGKAGAIAQSAPNGSAP